MYQLGYRCDVTGAQMTQPLPKREYSFLREILSLGSRCNIAVIWDQMMSRYSGVLGHLVEVSMALWRAHV